MICLNCGKELDNDIRVCPYCGNLIEAADDAAYYENYDHEFVEDFPAETEGEHYEETFDDSFEEHYEDHYEEEFVDDDPVYAAPRKKGKGLKLPNVSMPSVSGIKFPLSTVLSLVCCLISLICLVRINAVAKDMIDLSNSMTGSMNSIYAAVSGLDGRLESLDSTVAGVQSEAYNQLASQSIVLSKDITALTGPVTEGKYNIMFIINAKGNLNLNTSFDWQKYNEATGGWVSIVFTGNATTNDQYGLRLENTYNSEEGHYASTLWANGITPEAAGTYRCVIKDNTGITKVSAEATVQVS